MNEAENTTDEQRRLSLQFVGEQDGEPERKLKSALVREFRKLGTVDRAFLVRVVYGGTVASVSLGIVGVTAERRKHIVETVQKVFSTQFATDQHLDVMFPSAADEVALSAVCPPFFNCRIE